MTKAISLHINEEITENKIIEEYVSGSLSLFYSSESIPYFKIEDSQHKILKKEFMMPFPLPGHGYTLVHTKITITDADEFTKFTQMVFRAILNIGIKLYYRRQNDKAFLKEHQGLFTFRFTVSEVLRVFAWADTAAYRNQIKQAINTLYKSDIEFEGVLDALTGGAKKASFHPLSSVVIINEGRRVYYEVAVDPICFNRALESEHTLDRSEIKLLKIGPQTEVYHHLKKQLYNRDTFEIEFSYWGKVTGICSSGKNPAAERRDFYKRYLKRLMDHGIIKSVSMKDSFEKRGGEWFLKVYRGQNTKGGFESYGKDLDIVLEDLTEKFRFTTAKVNKMIQGFINQEKKKGSKLATIHSEAVSLLKEQIKFCELECKIKGEKLSSPATREWCFKYITNGLKSKFKRNVIGREHLVNLMKKNRSKYKLTPFQKSGDRAVANQEELNIINFLSELTFTVKSKVIAISNVSVDTFVRFYPDMYHRAQKAQKLQNVFLDSLQEYLNNQPKPNAGVLWKILTDIKNDFLAQLAIPGSEHDLVQNNKSNKNYEEFESKIPDTIEIISEPTVEQYHIDAKSNNQSVTDNPWFKKISKFITEQTNLSPLTVVSTASKYVAIINDFQECAYLPDEEIELMILELLKADSLL